MSGSEIASLIAVGVGIAGGILAYFKFKPGQREQVDMTIAQATMNVAHGTFQLVTTELEDQFKRMAAEMKTMREEHHQYRSDTNKRLIELSAELRAERAEKLSVKRENDELRHRVAGLEAEVARLKTERP